MADVTDKFKYLVPLWSGTVGTGGISDASVDSFALTSASGLIDGRIYNMTIDRVDSGGGKTLPKREVVTIELSGSNAINVVRGVEGTAQAHAAGAVVEILLTADQWNDAIDGILVEHNQAGIHAGKTVVAYTPASAGTTTIDLSLASINVVTMPADTQTLAISNASIGQCFLVEINNVTSQGALTWFSTIRWADGVAPTLTGTNGKKDTFGFRVTGTDTYDGFVIGQNI